ncbi:MAG: hypothetical protein AAFX87_31450 [Bacteroidota bacterium]
MKNGQNETVISNLAKELGIPELKSGKIIIRDERDWRINEKEIDYCWLINVSKSFIGWCWLFSVKFEQSEFREMQNSEELIQGIFTVNSAGEIENLYKEILTSQFQDEIRDLTAYDLFDANKGITLDGVSYEYIVIARNTKINMSLSNPNSDNWKKWEDKVEVLGRSISQKSGIAELKEMFK